MKWDDVRLKGDDDGREYLKCSEITKTRNGDEAGGSRAFTPKAFENAYEPKRCPVQTFERVRKASPPKDYESR